MDIEIIITCQKCRRRIVVPVNQYRRKFCDDCRPKVFSLSGIKGGGRPRKHTIPKPTPITVTIMPKRKRPDLIITEA